MEISAERMIRGLSDPVLEQEHLFRYEYASGFVADMVVLDIACGSGYGSRMLLDAGAKSVTGVDIAADAVQYASEHFGAPGVSYLVGSAESLSLPDSSFDVVVSFETIEHLKHPDLFVDEVRRVLRPGGKFICSTPDRRLVSTMYPLRGRPNNSFHEFEYNQKEFLRAISRRFVVEECRGQAFVNSVLTFWPIQVGLKASCYMLRRFGAYALIRRLYHRGSGLEVQASRSGVARFWVVRASASPS
jgi:SAM-dependent methyltransferase